MRRVLWLLLLLATSLARAAPTFFVEADVDTTTPWVQAQATLRLRFFQGADVRDIELAGPPARLADTLPLGATTVSEAVRDGRRYRVHERHFAILPFASGRLELAGAAASGRLPGSSRRSRWPAPAIALDVRPAPADKPDWLPARELWLTESWSAGAAAVPGQLMLRSVRIEATGVAAAQLPAVRFSVAGASVLARPPRIETRIEGGTLRASRAQDFEILPTRAGTLEIPPLRLAWWKVGAGGTAVAALAELSGRGIRVGTDVPDGPPASAPPGHARLAIIAVLLVCLGLAWHARFACRAWLAWRRHDPRQLTALLLDWGRRRWPAAPPASLPELAARIDHPAAACLHALDRQRYGAGAPPENITALCRALLRA